MTNELDLASSLMRVESIVAAGEQLESMRQTDLKKKKFG